MVYHNGGNGNIVGSIGGSGGGSGGSGGGGGDYYSYYSYHTYHNYYDYGIRTSRNANFLGVGINDYIVVRLPYKNRIYLPLQVMSIKGTSRISMPKIYSLPANTTFTSLLGGTITSPANSVIPEFSQSPSFTVKFTPFANQLFNENDIFELPITSKTYNDTLTVYRMMLDPAFLRIQAESPPGVVQNYFQYGRIALSPSAQFGFRRGSVVVPQPPPAKLSWVIVNDSNMRVKASMHIDYVEMIVRPIPDPYVIYELVKPSLNIHQPLSIQEKERHRYAREEISRRRVYHIEFPLYEIEAQTATQIEQIYGDTTKLVRDTYNTRTEALSLIAQSIEIMKEHMGVS